MALKRIFLAFDIVAGAAGAMAAYHDYPLFTTLCICFIVELGIAVLRGACN